MNRESLSRKASQERRSHCALCAELNLSIKVEDIVDKSYKDLSNLIDKFNKDHNLDIKITGGGYGFELSSYNIKAVGLFRKELKKLSVSKYYIISYIEGLDWYTTLIWKRNEVLRGTLCSSINKKTFKKTKNDKLWKVRISEKDNFLIQNSIFREKKIKEITKKIKG